jgi:hypothetical protein
MFTSFNFRDLRKYRRLLEDTLLCQECTRHLMRTACYLKMHVGQYPHTVILCRELMRSYLTIEGQEQYSSYNKVRAHIFDLKQCKKELGVLEDNPLYQLELRSTNLAGDKMLTRELPSPKCFPSFKLQKESKMWLTQLDKPTEEQVNSLKEKLRIVLERYGPETLTIPSPEATKSLGPSLYSDGHNPVPDYKKPENTWKYSWDYQRFKTDAQTEREVWLPPKNYKILSSWWHFYTEPIAKSIPWLVCNDTMKQVRLNVHSRFQPCRSIDLKGFGLQFPHEYILACMDVINEIYPSEETKEYRDSVAYMLNILSVRMEDGTYTKPIRGVGLGYFSNLMSIVVASLLAPCDIVQMFNDDILCPDDTYEQALDILTSHSFIINEKKTGDLWHKVPFFANVSMARNGTLHYFEVNGILAAVFTKKYHYQRKAILLASPLRYRWKANFYYEYMFGPEVYPCEAFEHPNKLGLDDTAPYPCNYVKGGLLKHYKSPRPESEEFRRLWSISFPWKEPKEDNFHRKRYEAIGKYRHHRAYMEYDEYLNPRIKEKDVWKNTNPDFFLGAYQLPRWADLQSIIANEYTCGRTTMGRNPRTAAHYMLQYLHSDNPIHSWLTGGYEIISPFARDPAPGDWISLLYYKLKRSSVYTAPITNKVKGENKLSSSIGDGLKFLQGIEISHEETDFVISESDIPSFEPETDSEEFIDLEEDCEGLTFNSDNELDDEISASDISDSWE